MIFGDPYRFAILIEEVLPWNGDTSFHNGLFHYIINGEMYPKKLRTATLDVDLCMLTDPNNALLACPQNLDLFSLPAEESFKKIYQLNYPDSSPENEYPIQDFSYNAATENLTDDGISVFSVAYSSQIRILIARTSKLIQNSDNKYYHWIYEKKFHVNEVILPKDELNQIIIDIKKYFPFAN